MSKTVLPFVARDISALAKSLHRELDACEATPGHLQLLNMLTRSAGYANFQHFRAQLVAGERLARPPEPAPQVDYRAVERAARRFDAAGRLVSWPSKASQRMLCLWVMWSRLPAGRVMSESEVNQTLEAAHLFGDPALLRRMMVDDGMMERTRDCRRYRRLEARPPADAVALIRHVGRPARPSA